MRRAFIAFLTGLLIQSLFLQPAFAQTRPVPAQARPVPAQTIPGPAYRINPGDEIMVSVWGDERLQRAVRVLPDGTFAFPLGGQVMAAGPLPADLERILRAALQRAAFGVRAAHGRLERTGAHHVADPCKWRH